MVFNIPKKFTQGDSITWTESNQGHDLSNTLKCFIRGALPTVTSSLDLTATSLPSASPLLGGTQGGWEFTINTNDSQNLIPGSYHAQFVLFNGSNRVTLGNQTILVLPSLEFTTNYDGRSKDEIELENIENAIASLIANGAVQEYWIGERRVTYADLGELYKERDRLRVRVAMLKNPSYIGGRNVKGGFC